MDVVEISEVEESVARLGERYPRRVFTERELDACDDGRDTLRLAACYAAKEAALKTLGLEDDDAVDLRSVEVVLAGPEPELQLTGQSARLAERAGISRLSASVGATHRLASAVVLAEALTPVLGET